MPFYSLLVSMPAGLPPTTRLPTAGGKLAAVRAPFARRRAVPAASPCAGVAEPGPASGGGPMRRVAVARDAARAWLRRTA